MKDYTKGPWKFDGEYVWAQSIRGYVASPATEDMTSGRCVPKNIAADTIEANGHLIAAAPELLEALVLAVDADGGTTYSSEDDEVGERSCCGEVSYKPHRQDCWVVKARATIAKAKGETK